MPTFIAEIKPRSPFTGPNAYGVEHLTEVAIEHGDCVAAHTESPWGGSLDHLAWVRSEMDKAGSNKPLLAKGIHRDDSLLKEALEIADCALVVGRWPYYLFDGQVKSRLIYEPSGLAGLRYTRTIEPCFPMMMWNARDLKTGRERQQPVSIKELREQGFDGWICQASFIRNISDVEDCASSFIVGTDLIEFVDSMK